MRAKNQFRVKLIFPPYLEAVSIYNADTFAYLPFGMGVLASFLRTHNYTVEQDDLSIKFNRHRSVLFSSLRHRCVSAVGGITLLKDILPRLRAFLQSREGCEAIEPLVDKILSATTVANFDLIGFSIFSDLQFHLALALSKKIKQVTRTPIVFGGAFINAHGHLYPEVFAILDYMIIGDGRIPLVKLIEHLKAGTLVKDVPNLIYRKNDQMILTPQERNRLEGMPIPDFSDLFLQKYQNRYFEASEKGVLLPYQISNRCASSCAFCNSWKTQAGLEFKSHDKVVRELRQMRELYKSRVFHFCDAMINNSYAYLEELCDCLIKNKLNILWKSYAKVNNLDANILEKMKKAGCYWLDFGIESGSDKMLIAMEKGFTSEQAGRTLRASSEAGIINNISLIAGYPHETLEDVKQTVEFLRKNRRAIHYRKVWKFELKYNSFLYLSPDRYGIENLKQICRYTFSFDETNGLVWSKKMKQREDSFRMIVRSSRRYMHLKNTWFSLRRYCGF